jgi:hypothetical protein
MSGPPGRDLNLEPLAPKSTGISSSTSSNIRESYLSDAILIGCTDCRVAMQLSLVLSVPASARRFTATFSATDVAGFLLP